MGREGDLIICLMSDDEIGKESFDQVPVIAVEGR